MQPKKLEERKACPALGSQVAADGGGVDIACANDLIGVR